MKKKIVTFSIISVVLVIVFIGCSKNNFLEKNASVTQEQIEFKQLAQAYSGRWLLYASQKIKKEHPGLDGEAYMNMLGVYLEPVNRAVIHYRNNLKYTTGYDDYQLSKWVDSLRYFKYTEVNNSLHYLRTMDSLYQVYSGLASTSLKEIKAITKFTNKRALSARNAVTLSDLPPVTVTTNCFPAMVDGWISIHEQDIYLVGLGQGSLLLTNCQKSNIYQMLPYLARVGLASPMYLNATVETMGCNKMGQDMQSLISDFDKCYLTENWPNPGGGGGGGTDPYPGGGGGNPPSPTDPLPPSPTDDDGPQTVKDSLTDPCIKAAFNKFTKANVKGLIATYYNTFVGDNSPINLTIKDDFNLTVGGHPVPAYSVIDKSTNTWVIVLNTDVFLALQYMNMSHEAWGQIILHEIIHGFIYYYTPEVSAGGLDHLMIFKNFVIPAQNVLENVFNLSSNEALLLALNGIRDNWGYGDFEEICQQTYGVTLEQITDAYTRYTSGTSGVKCGE